MKYKHKWEYHQVVYKSGVTEYFKSCKKCSKRVQIKQKEWNNVQHFIRSDDE